MPAKKRVDDPAFEDHIEERQPFLDWRAVAPRWILIGALITSFGLNGLFGTIVVGLVVDRFTTLEKSQNDPKWDLLARLATVQAEQTVKVKRLEEDMGAIHVLNGRMADMQSDLKVLSNRLERKGF